MLPELGGLAEFIVDVHRLRIEGHVGKQHVVNFGDCSAKGVGNHRARFEFLKIHPAHVLPLVQLFVIDAAFQTDAQAQGGKEFNHETDTPRNCSGLPQQADEGTA